MPNPKDIPIEIINDWVQRYNAGETLEQIARTVPYCVNTVHRRIQGIAVMRGHYPNRTITAEREQEIVQLYQDGMSPFDIATKIGVTRQTVNKYLASNGIATLPRANQPRQYCGEYSLPLGNNLPSQIRLAVRMGDIVKQCRGYITVSGITQREFLRRLNNLMSDRDESLTPTQARRLQLYKSGLDITAIAQLEGVHRSSVSESLADAGVPGFEHCKRKYRRQNKPVAQE